MSLPNKIRVADYIAQLVANHEIRDVFMVTGGGAMHLNDALSRNKDLKVTFCHHEQACAMAAESYFRLTNKLALLNVTTGPGGTNAITGVWGAWVDSLGMLVISGQVKWETLVRSTNLPLRQLGDQEIDITTVVSSFTKYSEIVTDPQTVRYHVEKAIFLAKSGRPGPTWLDIPMNVQGSLIDPSDQKPFSPEAEGFYSDALRPTFETIATVLNKLHAAKRPVIMAGSGVRIAGAQHLLKALSLELKVPVVTAWNAHDLIEDTFPYYAGRPGTIGDRAGNFAVQNADVILVVGSRLNIRQVSYNWQCFADKAYKIVVDIDAAELSKPTIQPDLPVHADAKEFLESLLKHNARKSCDTDNWIEFTLSRRRMYPVVLPQYWESDEGINPYCFVDALFKMLPEDQIVVTGDGTACVVTFQAAQIKPGQRLYTNSGCASMGYDLPAAIGAAIAEPNKSIICLAGDGSIQMNLQELQTIVGKSLPIKVFVLNNRGYHSIRQTQQNFFPDNVTGCGPDSGLTFPSFEKIANAFDMPYTCLKTHSHMLERLEKVLQSPGYALIEVYLDLQQAFSPRVSSRKDENGRMTTSRLEDMSPFLSSKELEASMNT